MPNTPHSSCRRSSARSTRRGWAWGEIATSRTLITWGGFVQGRGAASWFGRNGGRQRRGGRRHRPVDECVQLLFFGARSRIGLTQWRSGRRRRRRRGIAAAGRNGFVGRLLVGGRDALR